MQRLEQGDKNILVTSELRYLDIWNEVSTGKYSLLKRIHTSYNIGRHVCFKNANKYYCVVERRNNYNTEIKWHSFDVTGPDYREIPLVWSGYEWSPHRFWYPFEYFNGYIFKMGVQKIITVKVNGEC